MLLVEAFKLIAGIPPTTLISLVFAFAFWSSLNVNVFVVFPAVYFTLVSVRTEGVFEFVVEPDTTIGLYSTITGKVLPENPLGILKFRPVTVAFPPITGAGLPSTITRETGPVTAKLTSVMFTLPSSAVKWNTPAVASLPARTYCETGVELAAHVGVFSVGIEIVIV